MCRRFPVLGFDPIGGDRGTFGTGVRGDAGPFWIRDGVVRRGAGGRLSDRVTLKWWYGA